MTIEFSFCLGKEGRFRISHNESLIYLLGSFSGDRFMNVVKTMSWFFKKTYSCRRRQHSYSVYKTELFSVKIVMNQSTLLVASLQTTKGSLPPESGLIWAQIAPKAQTRSGVWTHQDRMIRWFRWSWLFSSRFLLHLKDGVWMNYCSYQSSIRLMTWSETDFIMLDFVNFQ